ncbi:hypothetical protein U3516DRAFT_559220 [Neocallimastix sp. 'constans']|jgi:hypothetical protein
MKKSLKQRKKEKLGLIINSNAMYRTFMDLLNQDYFVDKSNIINDFNKLISKNSDKYVCITKPRRFGKTSIAAMLVTYYSEGIPSKGIFDKLKVSKGKSSDKKEKKQEIKQYNEFQGKYHTIYINLSYNFSSNNTIENLKSSINEDLKMDIERLYPKSKILNKYNDNIDKNLERLCLEIGKKFVLILDEWDYIITNKKLSENVREEYIVFLKDLIKDRSYTAFVYMTGIVPIAKELSHSTLNCFAKYTMLNDEEYFQYFGFTEQEVKALCIENTKLKYKDLESWYNGYKSYNGENIFNPLSVVRALKSKKIKNYWSQTGRYDEVKRIINYDIDGVKEDILKLINGEKIKIKLNDYDVEEIQGKSKNEKSKYELYSEMVTYGFLTYCKEEISIPNKELEEKFIDALKDRSDMKYFYDMIENSEEMLKATLNKNVKRMCEILNKSHMEKIRPGDKVDHGTLKLIMDYVYFHARSIYNITEEYPNGKGRADLIIYPKEENKLKGEIIIIELKVDRSAEEAINQIKEKKYFFDFKDKEYYGNILFVGINYDKKNKQYSCIIEEYDKNEDTSEAKNKRKNKPDSDGIYKTSEAKKKRRNEPESEGVYMSLRSSHRKLSKNYSGYLTH